MMRALLSFMALATAVSAQDAGDPDVVRFFLPGQFGKVKEEARRQNRLILIKGVGFGVDRQGAACATKGKW